MNTYQPTIADLGVKLLARNGEIKELKALNADLLAALKEIQDWYLDTSGMIKDVRLDDTMGEIARVIAKAEGAA